MSRKAKKKVSRREFVDKKHGKAYKTLLKNIKQRRKSHG
jgi:hypothetical protein